MADGRHSRRTFIKRGLIGGALIAGGGGVTLFARSTLRTGAPQAALTWLDEDQYAVLSAIADRMIPARDDFPTPREVQVVEKIDGVLNQLPDKDREETLLVLGLFENALTGLLFDGRITPFTRLGPEAKDRALLAWRDSRITIRRTGFKALRTLVLAAYYASPETYEATGYPGPPIVPGSGSTGEVP